MEQQKSLSQESKFQLAMTVKEIFKNYRGILAADERAETLESRFYSHSIINTPETRRKFRELLFTTPQLEEFIGGVILNDETVDQSDSSGKTLIECLLERGIKVGIKLDKGLSDFDELQKISLGIEDLETRLQDKRYSRCSFAKWRSYFVIGEDTPTQKCINENMKILCKYAVIAQRHGLVPIIEPEIGFKGEYKMGRMIEVAKEIYSTLYCYLNKYNVYIEGTILKISFIAPSEKGNEEKELNEIGIANQEVIMNTLPYSASTVAFLSGGHSSSTAIKYLDAVNKNSKSKRPTISFSFGRGLTDGVIESWKGLESNVKRAQMELISAAREAQKANRGKL